MDVKLRQVGPFAVAPVGLGCMNLSHAYGVPPSVEEGAKLLRRAREVGYNFIDTAALYGFGKNETLIGDTLAGQRNDFILASKCGLFKDADGKRELNGHPDVLRATCEGSLARLRTDVIDLYYLHRWDKRYPVEDQIGALARLREEGKIRAIGISEISVATLKKAQAVHPIAAVQSEYSLWSRDPEDEIFAVCRELGIGFVPYSPLGRGLLTGTIGKPDALGASDWRLTLPRFQAEAMAANNAVIAVLEKMAAGKGVTTRSWRSPGCCIRGTSSCRSPARARYAIWSRTRRRPASS